MLWKSDGTTAGTRPVEGTGTFPGAHFQAVLGDILYFTTTDGGHGVELWRTEYDVDETVALYRASGQPNVEQIVEMMVEPPEPREVIDHAEKVIFAG